MLHSTHPKPPKKRTNSGSSRVPQILKSQPVGTAFNSASSSVFPSSSIPYAPHAHPPPSPQTIAEAEGMYAYSTSLRRASDAAAQHHPSSHPAHAHYSIPGVGVPSFSHPPSKTDESGLLSAAHQSTPSARFCQLTTEQTLSILRTHPTAGLASSALPALRAEHGFNEFSVSAKPSMLRQFAASVYESPLILLLLGSACVSALVGNVDDAVSIGLAVGIVLTVQLVQEHRSEKSLEALNKLVPHYCHLIRDNLPSTPLANDLVPGDLVTFSTGDRIPADVRLLEAVALEIDESSLTGETKPRRKGVEPVLGVAAGLGERACIAFMGTLVRGGHGKGVVVGTGEKTEFGVVFSMMQDVEERRTPLQVSMDDLAKQLSIISFAVIGVIFLIGVLQSRSWLEMFTIGVSLAVAAIPEGLPVVTTVTLALGVLRMSRRKAIVKKLPSVEALGSVSVICSDKTGTLTKNQMTVTRAFTVPDGIVSLEVEHAPRHRSAALEHALLIGNVCNNARKDEHGTNVGQATDVALLDVVEALGRLDQRNHFIRRNEVAFSSETKWMSVTGTLANSPRAVETTYLKGALEPVLARCSTYLSTSDAHTPALDGPTRAAITARAAEVADRGLRVLAMAYRPQPGTAEAATDFVFAGFQAMYDPPRPGVAPAIAALQRAGVHIVMITGDAERTALSIARDLGLRINPGSATSACITGPELDAMSDRQLEERVGPGGGGVAVFARTSPAHKMRIVGALQSVGKVVAMTGDGVNDAPALKMADIGVSMGKSGTDVAKEAADVILVDDNFATLLPAVEEGKSIFHNIQNFLSFQLSTAVAALSLITISTALHMRNPLNAMQILFINVIMDGPPSQSLGVDPVHRAVMRRPPRPKNASVITRRLLARVLFSASLIVLGVLFVYLHELSDGFEEGRDQTMTFTAFVFLDLASALQNRGVSCGLFDNRMLLTTVSISFVAQLALVYVPPLQAVFQTEALALRDLAVLLALGGASMGLHELRRRWERDVERRESLFSFLEEEV